MIANTKEAIQRMLDLMGATPQSIAKMPTLTFRSPSVALLPRPSATQRPLQLTSAIFPNKSSCPRPLGNHAQVLRKTAHCRFRASLEVPRILEFLEPPAVCLLRRGYSKSHQVFD